MSKYTRTKPRSDKPESVPTTRFVYNQHSKGYTQHRSTDRFIKGPLPLDWIIQANSLPGKAGAVGFALWFLAGVKNIDCFKVTGEAVEIAACTRQAFARGLKALESAGLILVAQKPGAYPQVTILQVTNSQTSGDS
jgi:hypothetical protein